MNGANVLVTGGAGFIGSNLTRKLCEMGASVTVLDDLTTGRLENLNGVHAAFAKSSVYNDAMVMKLASRVDVIFHLACRVLIASTTSPRNDLNTNVAGTLNVLLAANRFGAKVVYTSSASVYGNQVIIPTPEDATPDLLSPYAVSKYAGEGYCKAYGEIDNVETVVLRLSNVYGTNQHPDNPYCGVVSRFLRATMDGKPMTIYGSGTQTRDFTYIDDAVDAIIKAAQSPRAIGEVFNVGSGTETSISQLAVATMNLGGKPIAPEYAPPRDIDTIKRRAVNCDKARRVLRWQPSTPLRDGLLKTWRWMKGNE